MRMGRASRASTEERDEDGGAEVRMIMIIMVKTVIVMVVMDVIFIGRGWSSG